MIEGRRSDGDVTDDDDDGVVGIAASEALRSMEGDRTGLESTEVDDARFEGLRTDSDAASDVDDCKADESEGCADPLLSESCDDDDDV